MSIGRKISRRSQNIIKHIDAGLRPFEIMKKGYSFQTIRYYWRKKHNYEKYKDYLHRVSLLNQARKAKIRHIRQTII